MATLSPRRAPPTVSSYPEVDISGRRKPKAASAPLPTVLQLLLHGPVPGGQSTLTALLASGVENPVWLAYLAVFLLAALACFAAFTRVRVIEDPDTRRGLAWLLLTSGGWALALAGVVFFEDPTLEYGAHVVGLVVGLWTVIPWLYFCSAFTGRSVHRDRRVQTVAVAVFAAISLVKVTNPLHEFYFSVAEVTAPFPHLAFQPGVLHWIAMGLAYALAAVGYFMLFELFLQTDIDTRPFLVLVAVTGLPVVLEVLSLFTDLLLPINYEPLGVAVFAVGLFALYRERLQTIQLAGGRSEPTIVLDEDWRLRDSNADARALFPALAEGLGDPLDVVVPDLAMKAFELEDDRSEAVMAFEEAGGTRYYRVSVNQFSADHVDIGRLLVLDDVTEREQYRRELERQNERLEAFASMVSHDLRNPLNVASLRLESASADGAGTAGDDLDAARDALERMEALIEDVLALARQGQPIDESESVSLAATARSAWSMVESDAASLEVTDDRTLQAHPGRLQQLLENLFRNALEHGGTNVTVTVGTLADGDGFFVSDDGAGIPPEDRGEVFEMGYSTEAQGTGFGLAIVAEIAEAHHWDVAATEAAGGGARIEFSGVGVR